LILKKEEEKEKIMRSGKYIYVYCTHKKNEERKYDKQQ